MSNQEKTDVLLIGSGLAGCIAAYCLAKEGVEVVLVTNADPTTPSVPLTKAGVCYPIGETASTAIHRAEEGRSLLAIETLFREGPPCIEEILFQELHLPLSQERTNEEQQQVIPSLIDHDHTEKTLFDAFFHAIRKSPRVRLLEKHCVLELLTFEKHSQKVADVFRQPTCFGALLFNEETGDIMPLLSKETILATGGIGQLFSHTTNSAQTFGTGISMASFAGARLIRMDQIFFHPTTLHSTDESRFSLDAQFLKQPVEILNHRGVSIYKGGAHSQTTSDCMALFSAELSQVKGKHFWYDLTQLDSKIIRKRYPLTYETCLVKGFDLTKKSLPMIPAEHFLGGGIAVDSHARTSVHRLHAVGQVACSGVQGKEFDESIYLLESLVWGRSCAKDIIRNLQQFVYSFPPLRLPSFSFDSLDSSLVFQDQDIIQRWMWQAAVGIPPRATIHQRTRLILRELREQIEALYARRKPTRMANNIWHGIIVAQEIVKQLEK